jgi:hypothetical protein
MTFNTTLTCDYESCPTHLRARVEESRNVLILSWNKTVKFFHSTDCLAFYAASFPAGYVATGEDADVH